MKQLSEKVKGKQIKDGGKQIDREREKRERFKGRNNSQKLTQPYSLVQPLNCIIICDQESC